ncbi:hypothetical protein [Allopontixanthobacter sediminis]|uniref:Uncharacterized protein n=1 Tax=Allopontixanthobacter sediminis TaxID=1689985 RepID=A0A845AXV0_9SPHN|nr:hypothetical protein [Allopontixanthobacter sediminis]MXP43070.1 hypothetical protein [Allopontixanthobacter sediminis]
MNDNEKKTFTTQEGPDRGRDKPGSDRERPADAPKPKPSDTDKREGK